MILKLKNAEDSQCFSYKESNVCSSLHTFRHSIHCWNARYIFK